jgi:hypothetical protein
MFGLFDCPPDARVPPFCPLEAGRPFPAAPPRQKKLPGEAFDELDLLPLIIPFIPILPPPVFCACQYQYQNPYWGRVGRDIIIIIAGGRFVGRWTGLDGGRFMTIVTVGGAVRVDVGASDVSCAVGKADAVGNSDMVGTSVSFEFCIPADGDWVGAGAFCAGFMVGTCVDTGADVALTNGAGADVLVPATGLWLGGEDDGDLVAVPAAGALVAVDGDLVVAVGPLVAAAGALVAAAGDLVAAAGALVAVATGASVVGRRDEVGAAVPVPVDGAFVVGDAVVEGGFVLPLEAGDGVLTCGDDVGDAVVLVVAGALDVADEGVRVVGDEVEDDDGALVMDGVPVDDPSTLGEGDASFVDVACVGAMLVGTRVVGLAVVGLCVGGSVVAFAVGRGLGCAVGPNVGTTVGAMEGVAVGGCVGDAVGPPEGESVGCSVGGFVGAPVGWVEGAEVGGLLGVSVGLSVGEKVGTIVGALDGCCVGAPVGIGVGGAVGIDDGMAVGANVGAAVGAPVGAAVGEIVGS